ncbi:AAA family ATPase [Clostridium botulinum]|uniref:AAA family ATPase n=1 Tax=Clostridium botulinum TaxID=1491 RepID=UPI0007743841|nr:ATP-binding protein [Clostridium botulinum]MBY6931393.1 ATP-binding protein [Clostridium botulinum]
MLIMFRTKNFNSFKDDVVLDLRKTNYTQHRDHTFKCDNYDLLKTIAIYGANASGKSNLISAITKYSLFVIQQLYKDNDIDKKENENSLILANPFLLTNEINKEMEYEMVFYNNGYLFQYGYTIEEKIIRSEWLFVNDEQVFERNEDNIEFGEKYKEILQIYDKSRKDRLYIGVIDYFVSDKKIVNIMESFKSFFVLKLNIYTNIFLDVSVKGIYSDALKSSKIYEDDDLRKEVIKYVKKIDIGIKDILIDKRNLGYDNNEEKQLNISYAIHDVYNNDGEVIEEKSFDFNLESSGTIRFISIIEDVILMLEHGGVFVVDELSSRLHPVITKFIIDLFQSKVNINNAQLIFTTHDVSQMNKEQFRRDEIVLVDKNKQGISRIYALSDLDVRSDASFDKDYFKGKYGALPIVKEFYDSEVNVDAKVKTKCK